MTGTAPKIRHAKTADGVRIAFHVLGEGPPVLMLFPYHVNHLELNWKIGLHRRGIEFLARHFTVINIDFRGAGLSARPIASLSLDAFALDIEAVLAALSGQRVGLCAMGPAALVAFHFAARAPEKVSRIVTISAGDSEANLRVLSLRRINPQVEGIMRGILFGGRDNREDTEATAALSRAALDDAALCQWEELLAQASAHALAVEVTAPALCLHAAGDEMVSLAAGQAVARSMRDACFVEVPVKAPMQVWSDAAALDHMASFLLEGFGLHRRTKQALRKRPPRGQYPCGLTDREVAVLRMVAAGRKNQDIAEKLCISLNTVSHHMKRIFSKTNSINRTEAAAFAHRNGIS
jgi:DNA-binding CsgD family transcriptional regulator/pimeloyl-ACP methyl ester carboxylesterase